MGALSDKVILVTGAASGIGAACARAVLDEGAQVIWTDIRSPSGEQSDLVQEKNAHFIQHDVSKPDDWAKIENYIRVNHGKLDGLVNNAGLYRGEGIGDVTPSSLREMMAVNLEGALLGCQTALRLMGKGGSIVNVASVAALRPGSGSISYGASKAALVNLTASVAHHCVASGLKIRCNAICPGAVETTMSALALDQLTAETIAKRYTTRNVIGKMADPDDIAGFVSFLLSDRAGYITGAPLIIDGGMLL